MKKDVLENYKVVLLGYIAVIGIVLFFLLIDAQKVNAHLWTNFNQIYKISMSFVGILFAGMAFTNFRTKESSINYLTLPASNIEKTISQIILFSFGTMITYTIVFFISQFLFIAIGKAFYTIEIGFFNPFAKENIENVNLLIIAQSVFIAGASYFKKQVIFKTVAIIFILWLVIFGVFAYLMSFTLNNLPNNVGLFAEFGFSNSYINGNAQNIIKTKDLWTGRILEIFFTYLFVPILWVATYYNVKEKEV
jgi:hypothetical protein